MVCGRYADVPEKPGQTRPLRNALLAPGAELVKDFKGMDNLRDIFNANARDSPQKPFLGTRAKSLHAENQVVFGAYQWKTFRQVHDDCTALSRYLMIKNLCPTVQTEEGPLRFLSLYSKNREEWVTTDFACVLAGITVVTLYDTLGKDSIEYILDQTYMKTVVCQADKVQTLLSLKKEGKIPQVTHIIYFSEF
jgi:long-chain acyl-CoA synthetase